MPRPGKSSYSDEKPPCKWKLLWSSPAVLMSLTDSYIALTAMAIQQSPDKMLPLSDIYKVTTDDWRLFFSRSWLSSLVHYRSISLLSNEHPEMAEFVEAQSLLQWLFYQSSPPTGPTRQRQFLGFTQQVSDEETAWVQWRPRWKQCLLPYVSKPERER